MAALFLFHGERTMKYTVKDSRGKRVTGVRLAKGKVFLADITGSRQSLEP